jgi:hypothetical protein
MKAFQRGLMLLAIGVSSGALQVNALSAEEKRAAILKWEYRVLTREQVIDLGKKDLTVGLNKLGNEGWELVVAEPSYIFKRPREQNTNRIEDLKQLLLQTQTAVEMWKDRVAWSERMVKKGYLTDTQLQAEKAQLQSAELTLEKVQRDLKMTTPEPK